MNKQDRRNAKLLSQMSQLSTEELREYIRRAILDEETSDRELKVLLNILECRENETGSPAQDKEKLKASWKKFLEERQIEVTKDPPSAGKTQPPSSRGHPHLKKIVAMGCLCVLLLAVVFPAAQADRMLAKWLPEYFWFADPNREEATFDRDASEETEFDTVEEALAAYHITEPLVPTWFPEGYELQEARAEKREESVKLSFKYYNDQDTIVITILAYDEIVNSSNRITKNTDAPEAVNIGGVKHYFFQNEQRLSVSWIRQCYECNIAGDVGMEDMERMVRSIYE